jgi:hypothetical protein
MLSLSGKWYEGSVSPTDICFLKTAVELDSVSEAEGEKERSVGMRLWLACSARSCALIRGQFLRGLSCSLPLKEKLDKPSDWRMIQG